MKAFFALVFREIDERKALLAAAVVASLLPLLAPLLPSTGPNPAEDIREAVMWVMVFGVVPLFALLLGVSFIGHDLAEGRLGFYFAQPMSGPTIWFGKLSAVVLLVWTTELIIMLPSAVLSRDPAHLFSASGFFGRFVNPWLPPTMIWGTPIVVILLAHALGVIWRERSMWLVLDFIGLLLVAVGGWAALGPFLPTVAPFAAIVGFSWLAVWALVGLVVGGMVQVSVGRVDLHRGHQALATTLLPVLLSAVVVVGGWAWWVRGAVPQDLDRIIDVAVGSGDWIAVSGVSKGRMDYYPQFLLDTTDGRWVPAGTVHRWYHGSGVDFAEDMSRAVWTESAGRHDWMVMTAKLGAEQPQPERTGIVIEGRIGDIAVSSDGDRVALIHGRTVSVYRVVGAEQLTAARFDEEFVPQWSYFSSPSTLTIEARTSWNLHGEERRYSTYRFDLNTKELTGVEAPRRYRRGWEITQSDEDGRRLEEHSIDGDDRLILLDSGSGTMLADLGEMPNPRDIRIIDGERIVVVRDREDEHHIEVFDIDGRLVNRVDLDPVDEIYVGGEISSDRFAVGLLTWRTEEKTRYRFQTVALDLSTGAVESIAEDARPLLGWWGGTTSAGAWEMGALGTRLLITERETLDLWNPETGEVSPLVPGPV